ncbi:MAG: YraN family protein [Pseudomonadota bacterium]
MNQTGIVGSHAEKLAVKYLAKHGLKIHKSNFRCRFGEIDLIMLDEEYLVFVEVRYRKHQSFGGALESVDGKKQQKLRRTAEYFLLTYKRTDTPCRFDILCVDGSLTDPFYNWVKNAF